MSDLSQTTGKPVILLVEDEPLVAMAVEDIIDSLGLGMIGPAASVAEALLLIDKGGFHGALLDVNLRGERVDPVADRLAEAGLPFVFTSGYGTAGLPPAHVDRPTLPKPFRYEDLELALMRHILPALG